MKEFEHIPVLLNECIEGLNIKENGIYVDKKGESRTPSPSTKERIKSMFRLSLKK